MKDVLRRGLLAGCLLTSMATGWAQQTQVIADFQIPLDVDPETGAEKSRLKAVKATLKPGQPVAISMLTIEYLRNGEVDLTVTSPTCDYDQSRRVATSNSPVRIARENAVITGIGFKYDGAKEQFFIYDDVKLVIKNRKAAGLNLNASGQDEQPKSDPAE